LYIADEVDPDVNLNPFGAIERGVSRTHAKIERKNIFIYVTDLVSKNGTYLNSSRLVPYIEHQLRNGDKLQLGSLKMQVKFRSVQVNRGCKATNKLRE